MKNKICSIITMVLCGLMLVCIFLPLIKPDFSPVVGELSQFFKNYDAWEDSIRYSLFDILRVLSNYRKDLGSAFWMLLIGGLLPFLFPVIIFILSWLKGRIKYIINMVLAIMGLIATVIINCLAIPNGIEKGIKNFIDNSIAAKFLNLIKSNKLTDTFAENLAEVYSSSLTAGFYLQTIIIMFVMIIIVSVLSFFLFEKTMGIWSDTSNQRAAFSGTGTKIEVGNELALIGLTGIFKDAVIPIKRGEILVIGRDSLQCSVIIESTEISRKHCEICFDEITGQYKVTDYSSNGTFINDERRIMKEQTKFVKRGEVISVGGSKNSFRLN